MAAKLFTPIKVGVAGERYFEVVSGVAAGDRVITGPFASVRELADGTEVKVNEPPRPATGTGAGAGATATASK
jgi:HlyD family secretion protein